jgi:hypothetical protein
MSKLFTYRRAYKTFRAHMRAYERFHEQGVEVPLKYQNPWKNLVERIGKEMVAEMPERDMNVLGPFGIACNYCLDFPLKSDPDNEDKSKTLFLRGLGGHGVDVRDMNTNTGEYDKGSIGAMNGLNNPTFPIPKDATVNWFFQHLH